MLKKLTPAQQAWVDALRSGEYKQTKNRLQTAEGYCCLGVACRVAEQHGIPVYSRGKELIGTTLVCQRRVAEWLGLADLRHRLGEKCADGHYTRLTQLNDQGLSFAELADIIEYNADQLFKQEQ